MRLVGMEIEKKGEDFVVHQRAYLENLFWSMMSVDGQLLDRSRPQKGKNIHSWLRSHERRRRQGSSVGSWTNST